MVWKSFWCTLVSFYMANLHIHLSQPHTNWADSAGQLDQLACPVPWFAQAVMVTRWYETGAGHFDTIGTRLYLGQKLMSDIWLLSARDCSLNLSQSRTKSWGSYLVLLFGAKDTKSSQWLLIRLHQHLMYKTIIIPNTFVFILYIVNQQHAHPHGRNLIPASVISTIHFPPFYPHPSSGPALRWPLILYITLGC